MDPRLVPCRGRALALQSAGLNVQNQLLLKTHVTILGKMTDEENADKVCGGKPGPEGWGLLLPELGSLFLSG